MASKEQLKSDVSRTIDKNASDLHNISKQIWEHPELFYEEHFAHSLLTDYLSAHGFNVTKNYKLDTAFRADYVGGDGSGPHIAVLCEYDALPEIGHGCGHNLIAEIGVAAGLGIKNSLDAGKQTGKLTVLGTPAEEGGGGKVDLIRAGVFSQFDVAMMAHPGSYSSSTTHILAMTEVTVKYQGKPSHAAGFPWEGVNALDAAVIAYNNISALRQQMKPTWRVHGVITYGGEAPNIIPEKTELLFYLRAPTKSELQELKKKAQNCFEGAAQATGCKLEIEWERNPYDDMVANPTLVCLYEENAKSLGVEFSQDQALLSHSTGSTDMGNVSHVVPAIHPHFFMGTTEPAHTALFREAAGSTKAQSYTLTQAKAIAMSAVDILYDRSILSKIKSDFIAQGHTS